MASWLDRQELSPADGGLRVFIDERTGFVAQRYHLYCLLVALLCRAQEPFECGALVELAGYALGVEVSGHVLRGGDAVFSRSQEPFPGGLDVLRAALPSMR